MRVIFFGSTEFSLAGLEALLDAGYQVVGVVTQPDRPAGRGRTLKETVIKQRAVRSGIPVLQPERLMDEDFLRDFDAAGADIAIVSAYGALIPLDLLKRPSLGFLNLHASLLPRWRGAAPIQRAIMAGDEVTGVSLMALAQGMDTGDVLARVEVPIESEETGTGLEAKLATAGAEMLVEALPAWERGALERIPQDESRATYAPPLRAADRRIDWSLGDREVHDHIRALAMHPGAYTTFRDRRLIVLRTTITRLTSPGQPGELQLAGEELYVCSGGHPLKVEQVKPEGKRPMSGAEFVRGYRITQERMGE